MFPGQTVFSQVMEFLPLREFHKCVDKYRGDYKTQKFSCLDQFYCMAFAQLTFRESLRDIETCLRSMPERLYHMGIRSSVSRSTLAYANETTDWRIFSDFAQILIRRARQLYRNEDFGLDLDQTVYAFDSTTIDLCLSLFPWARFRKTKAAVKLHTQLDLRGSIPCFVRITEGKIHDVNVLDDLEIESGAIYLVDRGYVDFARLYRFTRGTASFVTRAKANMAYGRRDYRGVAKDTGLRSDQTIILTGPKTSEAYPDALRLIGFYDVENERRLSFLTNNFVLEALTIALLYKCRWRVELFFKWIKGYLRIKAFYGTSPNAVKTQIWIAITVYVLVAIIKKELALDRSPGEILQILSLLPFEQLLMAQVLTEKTPHIQQVVNSKQLLLFDL